MVTLDDLKKDKKEVLKKIFIEGGREKVISFCSPVIDKRAYFTINKFGKVKRKMYNYNLASSVFIDNDEEFLNFILEIINFKELIRIEKIGRMTNSKDEDLEKNIYKLLLKGEFNFLLKPLKEIYIRNKDKFFQILFNFTLMDNVFFNKTLAVYSLKKYFEKFGYSDEALYLTISYLAKQRADFYQYENIENVKDNISKKELKELFTNNIEKLKNKKGLTLLTYLLVLLEYDYENEKNYKNIFKNSVDKILKSREEVNLNSVETKFFETLFKEV